MTNITELKEKCSVIERCLPVSDFREQVAKTHGEIFEYITKFEAERDQAHIAAVKECVELIANDIWADEAIDRIRQHFGMDARFDDELKGRGVPNEAR